MENATLLTTPNTGLMGSQPSARTDGLDYGNVNTISNDWKQEGDMQKHFTTYKSHTQKN